MYNLPRLLPALLLFGCAGAFAQTTILTCVPTAMPPLVRAEGLTERVGDIVLNCSGGTPGMALSGNLTVFLSVPITNRITTTSATDVILTYNNGSAPQATVPGLLLGPSTLVFNNVAFTLSATGTVALTISDIRGNVTGYLNSSALTPVTAQISFNGGQILPVTSSSVAVAYVRRGLYAGFSGKIFCSPQGSPLPSNTSSFTAFLSAGAVFASTRLTEGFADAFQPLNGWANLNADTGERFLIQYSGFPSGARLFVPNVIAGSDATQPTAGGDFGLPASGGQYTPGGSGSLLLARVANADVNGAGGAPVYRPGAPGSGTVTFDSVSELPISSTGTAYVVYEVVDANVGVQESAQFPTFLGVPPFTGGNAIETTETVSFAPVSTVASASNSAPVPRFSSVTPLSDCSLIGDCTASYNPRLFVNTMPLSFTAQNGTPGHQVAYFIVNNRSGGVLQWQATVNFLTVGGGVGWLQITPSQGINNATIRVDVLPDVLAPGTYQANITVDGGPVAGTQSVPVTLTVLAPPTQQVQPPLISSVVSAASFAPSPVVPGSLTTIMGSKFSGKTLAVTFDGTPAQVLFSNDTQINLLVPDALQGKTSAQLSITVDGIASPTRVVTVAPFAPAIFQNGILNQDYSSNDSGHPAKTDTIVQIFATGLSGTGTFSVQLSGRAINSLYYAGPAPGFAGLQQVDVTIPSDIAAGPSTLSVCATTASAPAQTLCSPAAQVYLAGQ